MRFIGLFIVDGLLTDVGKKVLMRRRHRSRHVELQFYFPSDERQLLDGLLLRN